LDRSAKRYATAVRGYYAHQPGDVRVRKRQSPGGTAARWRGRLEKLDDRLGVSRSTLFSDHPRPSFSHAAAAAAAEVPGKLLLLLLTARRPRLSDRPVIRAAVGACLAYHGRSSPLTDVRVILGVHRSL